MKKYAICMLMLVFVFGVFAAEYAGAIDIYTFKKERVDQELNGNRGYLMGTPPAVKERGSRKRTLIGVDIELAGTSQESTEKEDVYVRVTEEPVVDTAVTTVVSAPGETKVQVIEVSSQGEETVREVDIQDEDGDEWIK